MMATNMRPLIFMRISYFKPRMFSRFFVYLARMKDVKQFLEKCTDKEIFEIVSTVGTEIKNRLIGLLKKKGCTSIYFGSNDDAYISVNDIYGAHGWTEGEIERVVKIEEIGYTDIFEEGKVFKDILYVITDKSEQYSGDEINEDCLWDLYKDVKDILVK